MATEPKLRVVIDCDTGVDDAMAILYGLLHPEIEVVGMTTVWGNTNVEATTANTLRLLELVDQPDIPVARGAAKPLIGELQHVATYVHGVDGQGDTNLPPPTLAPVRETAAELLVRLAHENPGELTLLPIGPMTNIGAALQLDPAIAHLYKNVVIMGGAFVPDLSLAGTIGRGICRWGEANIWHDPEAAQMMFEAPWDITCVGVEVTRTVRLTEAMLNEVRDSGTAAGVFLHRITQFYMDVYSKRWGRRECAMHDAIALGVAEDESLILDAPRVRVDVELNGTLTRGMTIVDLRVQPPETPPNSRVVLSVDTGRFHQRWMDTICGVSHG